MFCLLATFLKIFEGQGSFHLIKAPTEPGACVLAETRLHILT